MDESQVRRIIDEEIPFNRFLGLRLHAWGEDWVELLIPYRPELIGDVRRPALHGGVISTILDTAGGAAAMFRMAPDDRVSTVDMRVDYLRPGQQRDLLARAWVIRAGNRVIVSAGRAHHGDPDAPIAESRAVYNLRRGHR